MTYLPSRIFKIMVSHVEVLNAVCIHEGKMFIDIINCHFLV